MIINKKTCLTAGFYILNQKLLDTLFSKAIRSDGIIKHFQIKSFSNSQIKKDSHPQNSATSLSNSALFPSLF